LAANDALWCRFRLTTWPFRKIIRPYFGPRNAEIDCGGTGLGASYEITRFRPEIPP
jgi:hypothetical protein